MVKNLIRDVRRRFRYGSLGMGIQGEGAIVKKPERAKTRMGSNTNFMWESRQKGLSTLRKGVQLKQRRGPGDFLHWQKVFRA